MPAPSRAVSATTHVLATRCITIGGTWDMALRRRGARATPRCSQTLGCDASKHILVRSSRKHEKDRADTQIRTIRYARDDVVHAAWEKDSAVL